MTISILMLLIYLAIGAVVALLVRLIGIPVGHDFATNANPCSECSRERNTRETYRCRNAWVGRKPLMRGEILFNVIAWPLSVLFTVGALICLAIVNIKPFLSVHV